MKCSLCPRRCDALRTQTQNIGGFCGRSLTLRVARAAMHFWEEPCISGKGGSGTVFFSGCNLGCVYCQNYNISHNGFGKDISVERLAEIFKELEDKGAENINLVSPSHYALQIKAALDIYRPRVPVIWNSGGYDLAETLETMRGYVDIFLMDIKYLSNERALEYSAAYDYPEVVKAALVKANELQPEIKIQNGMMKKGVIVRHLLLPQATGEAINVFNFVREYAPSAYFSLMSQYTPCGRAGEFSKINRSVTKREYEKVLGYICESGYENCYIQERSSSSTEYIPPFDLTGV